MAGKGGHGCLSLIGLTVVVLMGLGVVAVIVGVAATDDEDLDVGGCEQVVYSVEGSGPASNITASRPSGMEQFAAVQLPWSLDSGCHGAFEPALLSAQRSSDDGGSITCIITRDGVEVSRNTSTGAYVIASCNE
jgi:hypothetical protein